MKSASPTGTTDQIIVALCLNREFFNELVDANHPVKWSRGEQVFVEFPTFVKEQRAHDNLNTLYAAYAQQVVSFADYHRGYTELVRKFGARAEDVRCLAKTAYDYYRQMKEEEATRT